MAENTFGNHATRPGDEDELEEDASNQEETALNLQTQNAYVLPTNESSVPNDLPTWPPS